MRRHFLHLRYVWLARRVARQQRWLSRRLYPNYGESENR